MADILDNLAGSVGWLIDATAKDDVLGSCFLVSDRVVITCAHPLTPYADFPEFLRVYFPATDQAWAIGQVVFHPDFDRWSAKRIMTEGTVFPVSDYFARQQNVAALKLSDRPKTMSPESSKRLQDAIAFTAATGEGIVSGSASETELSSIIQTLTTARSVGTITLCDKRKRPVARLFLDKGNITHARYRNSINEEAICRLICSKFQGHFFYQPEYDPPWRNFRPLNRNTGMVLIEAYRRLDEQNRMLDELGCDPSIYKAENRQEVIQRLMATSEFDTLQVFQSISDGVHVSRMLRASNVDGCILLAKIADLATRNFIQLLAEVPQRAIANASVPLTIDPYPEIQPGSDVYCLSIDPHAANAVTEVGKVIHCEESHVLYDIATVPEALGAPLLLDGLVIGIHGGGLPPAPNEQDLWTGHHIFTASRSVYTCLDIPMPPRPEPARQEPPALVQPVEEAIPVSPTGRRMAKTVETTFEAAAIIEASGDAKMKCVYCGWPNHPSDTLCSFCGKQLVRNQAQRWLFDKVSAVLQPLSTLTHKKATPRFAEVEITCAKVGSDRWAKIQPGHVLAGGDLLKFQIKPAQDSYVYVLYAREPQDGQARTDVLYPLAAYDNEVIARGAALNLPIRDHATPNNPHSRSTSTKIMLSGLPIQRTAGSDKLIIIVSEGKAHFLDNVSRASEIADLCTAMADEGPVATLEMPESAFVEEATNDVNHPSRNNLLNILIYSIQHK